MRSTRILVLPFTVILSAALVFAACEDDNGTETADSAVVTAVVFSPMSDVASHGAIGRDIAQIKDELAKVDSGEIDWAVVERAFEDGGASIKGDGSVRTLESLVDAPDDVAFVKTAINGLEPDVSEAVRAQRVDKGISVLLAAKVIDELAAAREKIAAGETDPDEGAPHNVDEAWAFFVADGSGLEATGEKRAADFGLEGEVVEPVIAALVRAQRAAVDGDLEAFDTATNDVRAALHGIFYLATYKYLDTEGDEIRRAEGLTFYRAIQAVVHDVDAAADTRIREAFANDDAEDGREALNLDEVIEALGVDESLIQP